MAGRSMDGSSRVSRHSFELQTKLGRDALHAIKHNRTDTCDLRTGAVQHGHSPRVLIVVTHSCMRLPVTGLAPLAAVECALARSAPKTRVSAATVKARSLVAQNGDGAHRQWRGIGRGGSCHDRGRFKKASARSPTAPGSSASSSSRRAPAPAPTSTTTSARGAPPTDTKSTTPTPCTTRCSGCQSAWRTRTEGHALSRLPRFPRPPHALHALETVCVFVCPLVVALWPRH